MEVTILTKEEMIKVAEALIKDKILNILDDLIKEAEENPEWKAVNALRCAKKEISNLKGYAWTEATITSSIPR